MKEFMEFLVMIPAVLIFLLVILFVSAYTNESPPTPEQIALDRLIHGAGSVLMLILIGSVIFGVWVLAREHRKNASAENRPVTWAELKNRPQTEQARDPEKTDKIKMLTAVGIALAAALLAMMLLR